MLDKLDGRIHQVTNQPEFNHTVKEVTVKEADFIPKFGALTILEHGSQKPLSEQFHMNVAHCAIERSYSQNLNMDYQGFIEETRVELETSRTDLKTMDEKVDNFIKVLTKSPNLAAVEKGYALVQFMTENNLHCSIDITNKREKLTKSNEVVEKLAIAVSIGQKLAKFGDQTAGDLFEVGGFGLEWVKIGIESYQCQLRNNEINQLKQIQQKFVQQLSTTVEPNAKRALEITIKELDVKINALIGLNQDKIVNIIGVAVSAAIKNTQSGFNYSEYISAIKENANLIADMAQAAPFLSIGGAAISLALNTYNIYSSHKNIQRVEKEINHLEEGLKQKQVNEYLAAYVSQARIDHLKKHQKEQFIPIIKNALGIVGSGLTMAAATNAGLTGLGVAAGVTGLAAASGYGIIAVGAIGVLITTGLLVYKYQDDVAYQLETVHPRLKNIYYCKQLVEVQNTFQKIDAFANTILNESAIRRMRFVDQLEAIQSCRESLSSLIKDPEQRQIYDHLLKSHYNAVNQRFADHLESLNQATGSIVHMQGVVEKKKDKIAKTDEEVKNAKKKLEDKKFYKQFRYDPMTISVIKKVLESGLKEPEGYKIIAEHLEQEGVYPTGEKSEYDVDQIFKYIISNKTSN